MNNVFRSKCNFGYFDCIAAMSNRPKFGWILNRPYLKIMLSVVHNHIAINVLMLSKILLILPKVLMVMGKITHPINYFLLNVISVYVLVDDQKRL